MSSVVTVMYSLVFLRKSLDRLNGRAHSEAKAVCDLLNCRFVIRLDHIVCFLRHKLFCNVSHRDTVGKGRIVILFNYEFCKAVSCDRELVSALSAVEL